MKSETPRIIIRQSYPVKCLHCGFRGKANLGRGAIQTIENGAEDWCPVCGYMALVGENYVPDRRS